MQTFFTSTPAVPSNTYIWVNTTASESFRSSYLHNSSVSCNMSASNPSYMPFHSKSHSPLASRTCPDLCVPSASVKLTISLYLGNLTYTEDNHQPLPPRSQLGVRHTLSRITSGPLTPPMVLYLILGVMLYDDDSRGSDMVAIWPEAEGVSKAGASWGGSCTTRRAACVELEGRCLVVVEAQPCKSIS